MVNPLRLSLRGTARSLKNSGFWTIGGAQGTGAITLAFTRPSRVSQRSLFSTKMPCAGCSEFGYSVVMVNILIGELDICSSDLQAIGRRPVRHLLRESLGRRHTPIDGQMCQMGGSVVALSRHRQASRAALAGDSRNPLW